MSRQSARLRDWIFGSTAKRLLIAALLAEPDRGWTKYALAKKVNVGTHGAVDQHLAALKQMGFVRLRGDRWQLAPGSHLQLPLQALLDAVELLPDKPVRKG